MFEPTSFQSTLVKASIICLITCPSDLIRDGMQFIIPVIIPPRILKPDSMICGKCSIIVVKILVITFVIASTTLGIASVIPCTSLRISCMPLSTISGKLSRIRLTSAAMTSPAAVMMYGRAFPIPSASSETISIPFSRISGRFFKIQSISEAITLSVRYT